MTPIALFAYARPEHARRTVEALLNNHRANETQLIVFSDGPRHPDIAPQVAETRHTLHTLLDNNSVFSRVTFVEREENWGLARSIIEGGKHVLEQTGQAIFVEDDIVTAPGFLNFILRGLDTYRDTPEVFTISGYSLPSATKGIPGDYPYDAYFNIRNSAWGWATWKDRWEKFDFQVSDYDSFKNDLEMQLAFNRGGDDLTLLLHDQAEGHITTWDIQTTYSIFRHHGVSLCPCLSLVDNIGFDGSGVHCNSEDWSRTELARAKTDHHLPDHVFVDDRIMDAFRKQFARTFPSLVCGAAQTYWDGQRSPTDRNRLKSIRQCIAHGQYEKARLLLQLHTDLIPGDPDALALLGEIALACDQLQLAEKLFSVARLNYGGHPQVSDGLLRVAALKAERSPT